MDYVRLAGQLNRQFDHLQLFYQKFIPVKLTPQAESILHHVCSHPDVTPSQIGDIFNISRSAVTQVLNRLKIREFIVRVRSNTDKRILHVRLDENGSRYEKAMIRFNDYLANTYYSSADSDELDRLLISLEHLIHVITKVKEDQNGTL